MEAISEYHNATNVSLVSIQGGLLSLVRMDIHTIAVGGGPIPSVIVLRSRPEADGASIELPIRIGTVEAMAISMGLDVQHHERPMTHDLLLSVITTLDANLSGVSIVDVHGTTFFAELILTTASGRTITVDSRPSDAIALAVRMGAPIFAEEHVLDAATLPDFKGIERAEKEHEMELFHDFVESLSPSDFSEGD